MKQDQMSMAPALLKPCPLPRSRVRRVLTASLNHETAPRRRQVHPSRKPSRAILTNHYRKKMGFPTPLRQWLRDPARPENLFQIMRAKDGLLASYIDPAATLTNSSTSRSPPRRRHRTRWRLLTLQLWGDIFLTGKRAERWECVMAATHPIL